MITSFNFYYARPGEERAVLRQRLYASDVRERLGLPRGRVLVRESGSNELPNVVWELEFADIDGHLNDMAARAASPEFEAVRAGMRKLYRRFERPLFEIVCQLPEVARDDASSPRRVVLDGFSCEPQAATVATEALRQIAASESALHTNRLLRRVTSESGLPAILWQREPFGPPEASSGTDRLDALLRQLPGGSLQHVEHSVWRVQ